MSPEDKQAARDKIAALRVRWERTYELVKDPQYYDHVPDDLANELRRVHHGYISALEALCDELTRPEPEDRCLKRRVAVWDAINQYVEACGGRSGDGVYGNIARQNAVVMVERALRSDPEPEDLVRDLERSIVDAKIRKAAGIKKTFRVQKGKW